MDEFSYDSGLAPVDYHCSACGEAGVKLWRPYNSFVIDLLCADCACEDQGVDYHIDEKGMHGGRLGPCDQIEWFVPAIPTEDGYAYWGYTSVPENGCVWWWNLIPTYRSKWNVVLGTALMLLVMVICVG